MLDKNIRVFEENVNLFCSQIKKRNILKITSSQSSEIKRLLLFDSNVIGFLIP